MSHQRDPLRPAPNRRNFSSVNLSDPRVQELLGKPRLGTNAPSPAVVQIAGDAPDPTGQSDQRGLLSTTRLSSGKQEVLVVFGDLLMTVDIYTLPGEPMKAHLICPRCHKMLNVSADRKRIEYDPNALNPQGKRIGMSQFETRPEIAAIAQFGRLSIETFECTWEIGDDRHVPGAVHTGASLCRLRLVIDDNRAREV